MAAPSYHTAATPRADKGTQRGRVWAGYMQEGILTALCDYVSTSDPSSGASPSWGADEIGRRWLDTGVSGTVNNPVLKRWEKLTAGPTYGWRPLRAIGIKWLTTPKALTLSGSPAAADVTTTDYDFSTDLADGGSGAVKDADGYALKTVIAVYLRHVVKPGNSETLAAGSDDCYVSWNAKGATDLRYVRAAAAGRKAEGLLWVALNSSQIAQYAVKVGGGTPAFDFGTAEILAIAYAY